MARGYRSLIGCLAIGAFFISSCGPSKKEKALSTDEVASRMKSLTIAYGCHLSDARLIIETAIMNNSMPKKEQEQALGELKAAKACCRQYARLAENYGEKISRLEFPTDRTNLYSLLEKNVEGFDSDPPEIQKFFSARHPGFKAEAIYSSRERTRDNAAEVLKAAADAVKNLNN